MQQLSSVHCWDSYTRCKVRRCGVWDKRTCRERNWDRKSTRLLGMATARLTPTPVKTMERELYKSQQSKDEIHLTVWHNRVEA